MMSFPFHNVSPLYKLAVEPFDTIMYIEAEHNTRSFSGIDPQRLARGRKARAPMSKILLDRSARHELNWCYTVYPTHAMAQEADMAEPGGKNDSGLHWDMLS
jgi:aminopeptidase